MQLLKAQRKRAKARIGISGPSGSGKTYSALELAYGLTGDWWKIAVIDSENGSSNNYSHLGDFNVYELQAPFSPERYIEAIEACEDAGMEVIIIDSVSHEWDGKGGCLEINEILAKAKFKGNTWSAWSETTPRHQRFIDTIVSSKAHIITTSRSKTDTAMVDGKPKKVGIKDIQREGFEYEMTLMFNVDRESHLAIASKDRTSLFIDRDPFLITRATGEEFKNWSDTGADPRAIEEAQKKAAEDAQTTLYESYITALSQATTLPMLSEQWTAIKEDAQKLGKAYLDDLTDRVKGIKMDLELGRDEKKEEEQKATTPKPAPAPTPVQEKKEVVKKAPAPKPTEPTKKAPDTPKVEVPTPAEDQKDLRTELIDQIRKITTEEEIQDMEDIIAEYASVDALTPQDVGVLQSHIGIRRTHYIPKSNP